MAKQVINTGSSANAHNGDPLRTAFEKVNANFTELYGGVGTAVYIGATPPANPEAGRLWWNSDDGNQYVFFNGAWVPASNVTGGGTAAFGDLNISGSTINNGFGDTITLNPNTETIITTNLTVGGDTTLHGDVVVDGEIHNGNGDVFITDETLSTYVNQLTNITAGGFNNTHIEIVDNNINGLIGNEDINLVPHGTGTVVVPSVTIDGFGSTIGVTIATSSQSSDFYVATQLANSSNINDVITANTYEGIGFDITGPYTVLQLTTPNTGIELQDIIGGAGVVAFSRVIGIGSGANNDIIIVDQNTFIPLTDGQYITTVRPATKETMNIVAGDGNNLMLSVGLGGTIVTRGDVVPVENNRYDLGHTDLRWKHIWVGPGSIFVQDEVTGADLELTARNNNFVVAGSAGLEVGNFRLVGNALEIIDLTADVTIGRSEATGKVIFNRGIQVVTPTGAKTFEATRDGRISISVPSVPANDPGALNIVGSSDGAFQPVTNAGSMLHITGNDGIATRVTVDNFNNGSAASFPHIFTRAARGTASAPSETQANDIIGRWSSGGFQQAGYVTGAGAVSYWAFQALENFSPTQAGSKFVLNVVPSGTTTSVTGLQVTSSALTLPTGSGVVFGDGSRQTTAAFAYTLPAASDIVRGGIRVGANLSIDGNGILSAGNSYVLPAATTGVLGGVIVGTRLSILDGVLSADAAPVATVAGRVGDVVLAYTDISGLSTVAHTGVYGDLTGKPDAYALPAATNSTLGGVITGSGVVNTSGTISVTTTSIGAVPTTALGAANGVATLDNGGKVPSSQLPTGGVVYKGTWNASTNTPTLADGVGISGQEYSVSVAGTRNLGSGSQTFGVGDFVIYNGTKWDRVSSGVVVSSVQGRVGDVVLTKADVGLSDVDNKSSATIRSEITSSNVTTALGFTPYNATNPSGYLSTAVTSLATSGSGFTVNTSTGAVTITSTATSAATPNTLVLRDAQGDTTLDRLYATDLHVGVTPPVTIAGALLQITADVNNYAQVWEQNINSGALASTDYVVTNDIGTDTTHYADFGIASSTYNDPTWAIIGPNDGYFYVEGGNTVIGTLTSGKDVVFFAGGSLDANEAGRIVGTRWILGTDNDGVSKLQVTGTVKATAFSGPLTGNVTGNVSGNAGTVTNGVYTTGAYADPTWITSLAGSKLTGTVVATNGVVTTGSYADPAWITSLAGSKLTGTVVATNGVVTTVSYSDPTWITSIAGSKITGGISGNATTVTNGVYTTGTYADPAWITSLAGSKITGAVATATTAGNATTVTNGVYTTDTGTVTNLMLAGNISNGKLQNSSVGIATGTGLSGGATISLGGSVTLTNTDPGSSQNIFKNIAVAGQTTVTSTVNNDTATFVAGSGMTITTSGKNITFTSSGTSGVSSAIAGSGISVSGATGAVTFTNTDRGSSQNIIKTISVQGDGSFVAGTNNDSIVFAPGGRMQMNIVGNVITVTDNAKGNKTHKVKHKDATFETDVVAAIAEDTLTFIDGYGIRMATDAVNQTITVNTENTVRDTGSATSATLDFSTDSMVIMAPGNNNSTITLSNYTAGRKITVIHKSVSTSKTITFGVSAAGNSSSGALTAVAATTTSCVILEYYCTGTTQASVYVSINKL